MPSNARVSSHDRDTHRSSRSSSESQYDRDRSRRSRKHDTSSDDDYYCDHDHDEYRRRRRHRSSRSSTFYSETPDRSYRSRSRAHESSARRIVHSTVHHVVPEGPDLPPKPTPQEELLMSLAKKIAGESQAETPVPKGFFASLLKEYKEDKSEEDPLCKAIPTELAEVLKAWWWTPPEKEDVKKILKMPKRPENVDAIKKVWINTEIFKRISQKGREVDNPYRYINNSIAKGAQPLTSIWSEVIRAESCLKDFNECDDKGDAILILPDRDAQPLNISALRKALDLSLHILGMTNAQLVSTRKANIKNYLHKDYQDLCDKKRSFTDKMFGENVKQQIEDISKFNRISTQLNPDKKKQWSKQSFQDRFLYRGRGSSSTRSRGGFNPRFRCRGRGFGQQQQQQGVPQQQQQPNQGGQLKAPMKQQKS